jgi:site-specific recombinase XerD
MEKIQTIKEACDGVAGAMERLQYSPLTIKYFRQDCRRFRDYAMQRTGNDSLNDEICLDYLRETIGYPFTEDRALTTNEGTHIRCIRRLLEYQQYETVFFIKQKEVLPVETWASCDAGHIMAYVEAMQTADNSDATKKLRTSHIRKFYQFLSCREINGIDGVSADIVHDFASSMGNYSPVFVKHILATLRNYFRFLYKTGRIPYDWSASVPRVNVPANLNVPELWEKEEIEKLLRSIDRGNMAGKRDYAIILLVVQLGLRISDVANLQLENLKWGRNELALVQHKTGRRTVYPLLKDVGWAIAEYLKQRTGANITSPYVFVKNNAPYEPMQPSSIGCVLDRCMRRAGLQKKHGVVSGMHSLRHALARRLLAQNTSLFAVADIMGHSSYASSSPYLKVDIEGMRMCALSLEEV